MNEELKGVEMYFEGKPAKEILADIKDAGFHWNGKKVCWYAKQSENTIAKAQQYSNNEIHTEEVKTATKKETKKNTSLWDRVQFVEGNADNSEYKNNYKFVGSNYTGLSTKETAKEIRTHLRKQFPEVKFSVTSDYNGIDIEIKSSPYNNKSLEYSPSIEHFEYKRYEEENNKELIAIKDYCNKLLNSYVCDDSDSMTDYFCRNFYGNVTISYEYIQTEQTETIESNIADFRNKLEEAKKAEEEKAKKEYEEYCRQQDERQKQYELRQVQEQKEIEQVNNNIEVKEIEENKQYFVIDSKFANLNKNNTLEQYQEEVLKGDCYNQTVKVTREIYFNDSKSLELFSNLLLHDFDFITGTGGSYTDDNRINSMSDYDNMSESERKTVQWNSTGIAVYLNDTIQFVIDSQGYSYARYVGLIDENTTITKKVEYKQLVSNEEIAERTEVAEKVIELNNIVIENNSIEKEKNSSSDNWNVFRKEISQSIRDNKIKLNKEIIQQIKENEYIKNAMYRVIKECEPTQDQFINADIQEGEKLTIIRLSMMAGASTSHIIFKEWKQEQYAQYRDNIKIVMNVKGKSGLYSTNLTNDKVLIYKGWFDVPKSVLFEATDGGIITKYGSFDDKALEDILIYFESVGQLPVINTYRPVF
jgi:hypothetical protein